MGVEGLIYWVVSGGMGRVWWGGLWKVGVGGVLWGVKVLFGLLWGGVFLVGGGGGWELVG